MIILAERQVLVSEFVNLVDFVNLVRNLPFRQ
jgi:hypothetical protein